MQIHLYTYTYVSIYVYIYICVYIYTYIYMYVYVLGFFQRAHSIYSQMAVRMCMYILYIYICMYMYRGFQKSWGPNIDPKWQGPCWKDTETKDPNLYKQPYIYIYIPEIIYYCYYYNYIALPCPILMPAQESAERPRRSDVPAFSRAFLWAPIMGPYSGPQYVGSTYHIQYSRP